MKKKKKKKGHAIMHEVKWRQQILTYNHTAVALLELELEAIQAKLKVKDPVLVLFTHRT